MAEEIVLSQSVQAAVNQLTVVLQLLFKNTIWVEQCTIRPGYMDRNLRSHRWVTVQADFRINRDDMLVYTAIATIRVVSERWRWVLEPDTPNMLMIALGTTDKTCHYLFRTAGTDEIKVTNYHKVVEGFPGEENRWFVGNSHTSVRTELVVG